jgi:hypothetical protein
MNFVTPGMLAYATFMTAVFQSLFGAFIRMRYQRTWESSRRRSSFGTSCGAKSYGRRC